MSQTIKIIDLFNKIANGEEVPNKIRWRDKIWDYWNREQDYKSKQGRWFTSNLNDIRTREFVTDIVEIIEDKEDINIQDIKELSEYIHIGDGGADADVKDEVNIKINEILRAVKYLEKTKEDK